MTATPQITVVHPTGNANVRQALLAFHRADLLADFHTAIAWQKDSFLVQTMEKLLPGGLRAEMARRCFPSIPSSKIRAYPWLEAARLAAGRLRWTQLTRPETGPCSLDAVCAALDRSAAAAIRRNPLATDVYAYDDTALLSFQAARRRGGRCFYELPIGYLRLWRQILREEREREPLWGRTLQFTQDSDAKLDRKDAEIAAADTVIVPSRFVLESLAASPARKVVLAPYGCPEPMPVRHPGEGAETEAAAISGTKAESKGPLKVLYVGSLSQRKGIGYLLRAMRSIGATAQLTIVGRLPLQDPELLAQLAPHRWFPSLPHPQVLETMRGHDVLVLPTLFEGRALVTLEALAQGLPVITTANAGVEDVVLDGISGFQVPIRSWEAIASALAGLAEDRPRLAGMSLAALEMAAGCTWAAFRQRLVQIVTDDPS